MKRIVCVFVGLLLLSSALSAGTTRSYKAEAGDWELMGNRLYQRDNSKGALVAHIEAPQEGLMVYNFNVRYEGGAIQDRQGGFGVHIFVSNPSDIKNSWGDGKSVLLWLNYDANPVLKEIPAGLSAEIYRSTNNSIMDLVGAYDLNALASVLSPAVADSVIPVRLTVNGKTGEAWIQSPLDSSVKYAFNLGEKNLKGDYVSLRTNGMAVSFGL
ncbi:MAG: hypothetical protein JXA95_08535 [Spirochaetales bacterium]|nr:hypothetical protein [Spirochaetales bacterium]